MPINVSRSITIRDHEIVEKFSASGGPGGQHANKAATRVELTWNVETSAALTDQQRERLLDKLGPVVRVVVDQERSQVRNREIAQHRLAQHVRSALDRPRSRRPTKPSRGAHRRRLAAKKRTSTNKQLRKKPTLED